MNIVFFASDKPRERRLARSFTVGAELHGHSIVTRALDDTVTGEGFDLACMVGVKSKVLWQRMRALGVPTMMFDKGYTRQKARGSWLYWRVAYNSHQPTDRTMQRGYSDDRFNRLRLQAAPWREKGHHILIAGSSGKYHNFYGLPSPTDYAQEVVRQLRVHTDRPIIYRPKPSWREAVPIQDTTFSKGVPLASDLQGCHAVVTHGSNACYEAALHGVPSIILGEGVMKSVSSTKLEDIEEPLLGERAEVFNALAYHQWKLKEFERGAAFGIIEGWINE